MPVELKFYNENNQEINLASGLDLGLARKGVDSIVSFKVQNVGNVTGRDLVLSADTLNIRGEVSDEEFANQLMAKSWKSFSFKKNGIYTKNLNLGTLKPQQYVEGTKETIVGFKSPDDCIFKESWSTGITEFRGEKLIFRKNEGETIGNITRRMYCYDLGTPRDVEIEFSLDAVFDSEQSTSSNAMVMFPVRINSNGDGKGYLLMFELNRKSNKFAMAIYKHAKGLVDSTDRVYGTRLFDTGAFKEYVKGKTLGFKIYNNALGNPCFEVMYGGENLGLVKSDIGTNPQNVVCDDTADAYKKGGEIFYDINLQDGDISYAIYDMTVQTEDLKKSIYVKTVVGDEAIDKVEYRSSALISYIED